MVKKSQPELADDISADKQALFDSGTKVVILTQQLFPNRFLIPYDGLIMNEQAAQTTEAIADGHSGSRLTVGARQPPFGTFILYMTPMPGVPALKTGLLQRKPAGFALILMIYGLRR